MNPEQQLAATRRAATIRRGISRTRLVFLHLGSAFDPIRTGILGEVEGEEVSAMELLQSPDACTSSPTLIVTFLEELCSSEGRPGRNLAALRELVFARMDAGQNVCLVSRVPRTRYGNIIGSSVLEDASLTILPLLEQDEVPSAQLLAAGGLLPSYAYADDPDLVATLRSILEELGFGVLSALDHMLFEVDPGSSTGLQFLNARDVDALRGAGLVKIGDDGMAFLTVEDRRTDLKTALSDILSEAVVPSDEFTEVIRGLWFIERTLRTAVRRAAKSMDANKWRGLVVQGDLANEVLRRARLDVNPSAASIRELRDPLEWLTLSELLEIATSARFNGLSMDKALWHQFSKQVVAIRNRVSHMRHLCTGDDETVTMWVEIIRKSLGAKV